MSIGTRDVTCVEKSPLHGAYRVVGATSGHVIHTYSFDERRVYSDEFLANERVVRGGPAWKDLSAVTRGRKREDARQLAYTKAVDTSAVVTKWDR